MKIGVMAGRLCALILVLCASSAWADYSITCGSEGGHYRACQLREPGNIRLARQISGAKCEQGRSWDFNARELWVDRGCEAEFVVEVPRGGYGRPRDDERYRDPNYYGGRHSSYIPGWMVGTFRGFDEKYRSDVTITVRPDGRAQSVLNGRVFDGYVNEEQLHVGDFTFDLDQTRDGFTTSQRGERENIVRYRRVN